MAVSTTADGGRLAELSVSSLEMTGCKEATIGTRVDLRGDFVVNQFLRFDNPPPPEELSAIRNALVKDTRKKAWWEKLPVRSLALSLLVATIMSGGIVATTLLVKSGTGDSTDDDALPQNFSLRFRNRSDWSAMTPNGNRSLSVHPARYLVVCHTGGNSCLAPINCEVTVQSQQRRDLGLGLTDIQYNFLIGGDGLVYEGRGWGLEGSHTFGVNCASLGVAFIGDFNHIRPKKSLIDALFLFIEESVKQGQLAEDYKLFFQNQFISKGGSPGEYIIDILKTMHQHANVTKDDFLCA